MGTSAGVGYSEHRNPAEAGKEAARKALLQAGIARPDFVFVFALGGEEQDGNLGQQRIGAHLPAHGVAVHARHDHIQRHQRRRLAAGGLQTVGTDHCPFFYEGQKELGRAAFTDIPNGMPGIEARLALLYTVGVGQGRLSLNRWVEVCCAAPARIFGLYPRKGTLAPGASIKPK